MKKVNVLLLSIAIYFFAGCSSKEYYKPQVKLSGEYNISGKLPSEIRSTSFSGATLEDGKVISSGLKNILMKENYTFISESSKYIISTNIEGKLLFTTIADPKKEIVLDLKKTIAAATLENEVLAVLFADNEIALYDFGTKELLFKESGGKASVVDNRIVNPYFLNDLVIFLTLDGKVVIVSSTSKEVLRSSIVSSEDNFNNIIYFNVVNNKLLAATTYKLLVISEDEKRESLEMRDILLNEDGIYVTTKQGEIILLSDELKVKEKKKFPFAHFLGMIVKDKIYLLEKEGYMVVLEKDFSSYKVYEVDIDDGYIYVDNDNFYFDDKYINIEKNK